MGAIAKLDERAPAVVLGEYRAVMDEALRAPTMAAMAHVRLVPLAALPALIAAAERQLTMPTKDEAKESLRRLLGSYLYKDKFSQEDMAAWGAAMLFTFLEYPQAAAAPAVRAVTAKAKYIPTRAEMVEALDREWRELFADKAVLLAMQREHGRRAAEAAHEAEVAKSKVRADPSILDRLKVGKRMDGEAIKPMAATAEALESR